MLRMFGELQTLDSVAETSDMKSGLQQKYDWFMVVRNPYDRILSEFYCKWGGVGKNALQYNKKQFKISKAQRK